MSKLSIIETEALILHELTHIKNNDFLFNWFLIVNEHIFFFNPFIKRICNQIRWERELRCDLQVLDYDYNEITYAESLYKVAIPVQSNTSGIFLAAVSNRFSLLKRIEFFTSSKQIKTKPSRIQQITFSFSMLILVPMLTTSVYFNVTSNLKKYKVFHIKLLIQKMRPLLQITKSLLLEKKYMLKISL